MIATKYSGKTLEDFMVEFGNIKKSIAQIIENAVLKKYDIMETEFISLAKKEESKTTFTHIHNSEDGWVEASFASEYYDEASFAPEYYDKVVYLGNCVFDGDMFACYKENTIEICKGFAGREFK